MIEPAAAIDDSGLSRCGTVNVRETESEPVKKTIKKAARRRPVGLVAGAGFELATFRL
jgi:hypothetical protein